MPITRAEQTARRAATAAEVAAGEAVKGVAVRHAVAAETVVMACHEHGVAVAKGSTMAAPSTYAIVARLCNTADTLMEVARSFGVSKQRVSEMYAKCKEAGVPVQDRPQGMRRRP